MSQKAAVGKPRPAIVALIEDFDSLIVETLMPFLTIADIGQMFATSKGLQSLWMAG